MEDMPVARRDVKYVRYSSNGMDCGVLVADIVLEQNQGI